MPLTQSDVFAKVQGVLVDALGVDDNEVTPEATLKGDLGAESIDYLDISFRLEKAFEIEIPRLELLPEDILSAPEFVDGVGTKPHEEHRINEAGFEALQGRLSFMDLSNFPAGSLVNNLGTIFTVKDLCRFIEQKVGAD